MYCGNPSWNGSGYGSIICEGSGRHRKYKQAQEQQRKGNSGGNRRERGS